jgi:hypothetical protein
MLTTDNARKSNRQAIQKELPNLEKTTLTNIVRQALVNPHVELLDWRVARAGDSMGPATAGVYRITGAAIDHKAGNQTALPWSVILKVISARTPGSHAFFRDEAHPLYWKREALVYQSGLLDDLPGGLRAPLCYAVEEKDADTAWLWLEDVKDASRKGWRVEDYAHAARCLGRFNGAYLVGRPMPSFPWLVRDGSPRGLLDHNTELRDLAADPGT